MALSRRLFLGGLFVAAAAPAIVTSKGFREAVCAPKTLRGNTRYVGALDELAWYTPAGTVTGRLESTEPAWQELHANVDPTNREFLKRVLFCQRYGTKNPFKPAVRHPVMVNLDFSDMEQRIIAAYPLGKVVS